MRPLHVMGIAACLLSACASEPKSQIVALEDQGLEVIGTAEHESDARNAAVNSAKKYCGKFDRYPVFPPNEIQAPGLATNDYERDYYGRTVRKDAYTTEVFLAFRCSADENPG